MSDIYSDWREIEQAKKDKAKAERDEATLRHLGSIIGEQVNAGGWIADASGARLEVNGVNKLDTGLGQFFKVGSDTSNPEHTALAIFLEDQNYNTEDFSESDMLFGCNSAGFANMFWDASIGQLAFRSGTTTTGIINTDGNLLFGSDISAAATTSLGVFSTAATYNSESMGAGDILFGCNTAAYANMLWDASDKQLKFRGGTTTAAYIDTDGSIKFGGGAGSLAADGINIYNGASLTFNVQPDGDMFVGSLITNPVTTSFSIFTNLQTYNSESMGSGDVLFGCNSAGYANMLWDMSAKQLKFRGGTTTQAYIDVDGSIKFGGGAGWLDADGQSLVLAEYATPNLIKWMTGTEITSSMGAYKAAASDYVLAFMDIYGTVTEPTAYIELYCENYAGTSTATIELATPPLGIGTDSQITFLANKFLFSGDSLMISASALILPNNSVSYAEIQDTASANVVLGQTGVAGDIVEIPCTAAMRGLMDDTTLGTMKATLDLEIGTDVQAWDADLDLLAGCTPAADGDFIVGHLTDAPAMIWQKEGKAAARTSMGVAIGSDVQAWDAQLDEWSGIAPSANGASLVAMTYAQMRGVLGLGAILTAQAGEDTIDAASTEYLPLSGVAAAHTYVRRCFIIPFAGTAQNLYVRTVTSQPAEGNLVMTVQKNNANTVVTVTVVAGGAAAITADVTHSFAFDKGDRLTLAAVNNAASNVSAGISAISLELLKDV